MNWIQRLWYSIFGPKPYCLVSKIDKKRIVRLAGTGFLGYSKEGLLRDLATERPISLMYNEGETWMAVPQNMEIWAIGSITVETDKIEVAKAEDNSSRTKYGEDQSENLGSCRSEGNAGP